MASSTLLPGTEELSLHDWRALAARLDYAPPVTLALQELLHATAAASKSGLRAVVAPPCWLGQTAAGLSRSATIAICCVGREDGADTTATKLLAAEHALAVGAREIEVTVNVAALCSSNRIYVETELRLVRALTHEASAQLSLRLPLRQLSLDSKIYACQLAARIGADCVTAVLHCDDDPAHDLALLRGVAGTAMQICAAAPAATLVEAASLFSAGAGRIATPHAHVLVGLCRNS